MFSQLMILSLAGSLVGWAIGSEISSSKSPTVSDLESQLDAMALGDQFTLEEQFGAPTLASEAGAPYAQEAPYKTFLRMEPTEVPDHVLLAILLAGSTKRSPVQIALELLNNAGGDIASLERADVWESVTGVGDAGRARVLAADELIRRSRYREAMMQRPTVRSADDAFSVLRTLVVGPYEKLAVLYLDRRHRVIGSRLLTVGSSGYTIVDPSQVLRPAVQLGSAALILAHQHPSGDPTPSQADIEVTRAVGSAGRHLGIKVLDHLVIGSGDRWTSLAEQGRLPVDMVPGVQVLR